MYRHGASTARRREGCVGSVHPPVQPPLYTPSSGGLVCCIHQFAPYMHPQRVHNLHLRLQPRCTQAALRLKCGQESGVRAVKVKINSRTIHSYFQNTISPSSGANTQPSEAGEQTHLIQRHKAVAISFPFVLFVCMCAGIMDWLQMRR